MLRSLLRYYSLACLLFFSLSAIIISPIIFGQSSQLTALATFLGSFGFFFELGIITVGLLLPDLGLRCTLVAGLLMSGTFAHLNGLMFYFSTTWFPFELDVMMVMRAIGGFSSGVTGAAVLACLPLFHTSEGMKQVLASAVFGLEAGPALGAAVGLPQIGPFYLHTFRYLGLSILH